MYLLFRLYSENSMDYSFWKFDNVEIVIVFGFYAKIWMRGAIKWNGVLKQVTNNNYYCIVTLLATIK